jgi:hypothetical protein
MVMPFAATADCDDYTFESQAEPSFIAPSVIRVQTRPRSARLLIEIGHKYKEALVLDRAMAQAFCERLKQALSIEQSNKPSIGLDGIEVQGNFKEAASPQVNLSSDHMTGLARSIGMPPLVDVGTSAGKTFSHANHKGFIRVLV